MFEISSLSGGWGPTTIVEDLSLTVETGDLLAILGRNGVGKSTLLELIVGRAMRRAGSLRLDGIDLAGMTTQQRAMAGIGYVPQAREVFPSLSVRENLRVGARPGRWTERSLLDLFPSLAQRLDNLGAHLSGGEQQMLSIARALSGNPKLLLMDEPSEGLAPIVVEQLIVAMQAVAGSGDLTIILAEQRADIALDLSNRCVVMERGRIVHQTDSATLIGDEARLGELIGLKA